MSSGNYSCMSMLENQEKKQIPRYKVRFTNKNHPFMWLVCKTRAKILLSDPETSLTTPRLLPLRRSRRSYGNYQSPQSSASSRNILKRLGRSGRSYGNQALEYGKWVTPKKRFFFFVHCVEGIPCCHGYLVNRSQKMSKCAETTVGSFNIHDNNNIKKQWFFRKTTALHEHHTF